MQPEYGSGSIDKTLLYKLLIVYSIISLWHSSTS